MTLCLNYTIKCDFCNKTEVLLLNHLRLSFQVDDFEIPKPWFRMKIFLKEDKSYYNICYFCCKECCNNYKSLIDIKDILE
jgi:hypothetical protein